MLSYNDKKTCRSEIVQLPELPGGEERDDMKSTKERDNEEKAKINKSIMQRMHRSISGTLALIAALVVIIGVELSGGESMKPEKLYIFAVMILCLAGFVMCMVQALCDCRRDRNRTFQEKT